MSTVPRRCVSWRPPEVRPSGCLLWPLIPIGLMIGIAAMILLAIVALLIVVAGVVIWLFGRVLVGLGWSEAEPLVDAGGGIAAAM
jgi:hypothetical protein